MKLSVALILICALAAGAQAQIGGFGGIFGPPRPFIGFPSSQFFQEIVLQAEAQKLLAQPGLPEDLQQRVIESLSNAELGFSACNSAGTANALPWIQIRCITTQLQVSKNALKAIDDEAKARAAASPAPAPAASAGAA